MSVEPVGPEKKIIGMPLWATQTKWVRKRLGESQAVFGARFGVTSQAVSTWETATCEPGAEVLMFVFEQVKAAFDE